jgi:hypothetical protein
MIVKPGDGYPAVQTFSIITVDADDVIRIKETI